MNDERGPMVDGPVAAPRQPDRLIIFDSSTTWDSPWMAFQHIALHLAERSPVLFVDAPVSPVSSYRMDRRLTFRSKLTKIQDNLYRLTPAAPPGFTRAGVHRVTARMVQRAVRNAVADLGFDVHAILSSLSYANLFGIADDVVRVYYASDDFVAGAALMGLPVDRLSSFDAELASEADTIVAISPDIAHNYTQLGHEPVLIPNGVEIEAFTDVDDAPLPSDVSLPSPVAGYIGQIGDRIDFALLEAVADAGVSLLLVGPRQGTFSHDERLADLTARPNVTWVGAKAFSDLASYLRIMDVGLVPYSDSQFNRASFPLKMLEYLAAGRPVVATPLPAVRWLDTELIDVEETPASYAAAVARAASVPRTPLLIEERRTFARRHSWKKRVDELAAVLQLDAAGTDSS